jgi:hypothetical protein
MEKAKEIVKLILVAWVLGLLTWGAVMLSGYLVSLKKQAMINAKIDIQKVKNQQTAKNRAKDPRKWADELNKLIGVN